VCIVHDRVLEIVPGKMERMHEHQNMRNNNLISRLLNFRNSKRGGYLNFYLSKQQIKKIKRPIINLQNQCMLFFRISTLNFV
jgi:hypothetical protein